MKKLLLLIGFIYLTFAVKAQPTFHASDMFTTIGTEFATYQYSYVNPGASGMNVTWNFSGLMSSNNTDFTIVSEGSADPNAIYPTANVIIRNDEISQFEYYRLNESTYDMVGDFWDGNITYFYDDPMTILSFPFTLNDAFSDTYSGLYTDVFLTYSNFVGTRNTVVDGYGTLKLPWGDFNAYRLTTEITKIDSVGAYDADETYVGYTVGTIKTWLVPGFPVPALTVKDITFTIPEWEGYAINEKGTEYVGDFTFVGIDDTEIVDNLTVYPNPAVGDLNIVFSKTSSETVFMDLYDVRGRKLKSIKKAGIGTGDFNYTIDVSDVPAGFYLLKLTSNKGEQGIKVVVK